MDEGKGKVIEIFGPKRIR